VTPSGKQQLCLIAILLSGVCLFFCFSGFSRMPRPVFLWFCATNLTRLSREMCGFEVDAGSFATFCSCFALFFVSFVFLVY